MIEFDEVEMKMVLKLVYYGPAMSGKTTNLLRLHDLIDRKERGDLMMLDTKDDRTIFFDLLPFFLKTPGGMKIKLKVYTVPGQVRHDATRKAVLSRADGVAFIADSQVSEASNNSESFENLEKNLSYVGIDIDKVPLVVQFNKKDLANTVSEEEIRQTWDATGIPVFMASALKGWGVLETFRCLVEKMYEHVDERYFLERKYGLSRDMFAGRLTGMDAGQGRTA
ncbi:MAG: GTPase domain-containing protein [Nitrospiraceae bacterium]|nr:GTPase domain-containing protein [Nitrospiraceae bacterium]